MEMKKIMKTLYWKKKKYLDKVPKYTKILKNEYIFIKNNWNYICVSSMKIMYIFTISVNNKQ